MALQKILFISAALALTLSKLSSGTPTASESNSTALAVTNQTAPAGAHHVLRPFNGSALNHDTQSAYVYCSTDSYCHTQAGYYSECYNGACICDVGYHSSNGQCISTYCTFDSDCTSFQANTRCNVFHSCVCDYDTYKNVFSQTCLYYNGGGGNAGEAIGFSFGGFIFLIIIISVCVICCRRRRDRIIRVVGPPAGARVQQQQQSRAGPGFVQPQPGYYQQNPQGYQQSYQQQQPAMPMPQPVAYQNPNYQQQQQAPPPYNPAFAAAPASGYPPIGGKM